MKNKTYLMIAGTFLPAFTATALHMAYHKRGNFKASDLLIFALASSVGGYITAQMLKENVDATI